MHLFFDPEISSLEIWLKNILQNVLNDLCLMLFTLTLFRIAKIGWDLIVLQ